MAITVRETIQALIHLESSLLASEPSSRGGRLSTVWDEFHATRTRIWLAGLIKGFAGASFPVTVIGLEPIEDLLISHLTLEAAQVAALPNFKDHDVNDDPILHRCCEKLGIETALADQVALCTGSWEGDAKSLDRITDEDMDVWLGDPIEEPGPGQLSSLRKVPRPAGEFILLGYTGKAGMVPVSIGTITVSDGDRMYSFGGGVWSEVGGSIQPGSVPTGAYRIPAEILEDRSSVALARVLAHVKLNEPVFGGISECVNVESFGKLVYFASLVGSVLKRKATEYAEGARLPTRNDLDRSVSLQGAFSEELQPTFNAWDDLRDEDVEEAEVTRETLSPPWLWDYLRVWDLSREVEQILLRLNSLGSKDDIDKEFDPVLAFIERPAGGRGIRDDYVSLGKSARKMVISDTTLGKAMLVPLRQPGYLFPKRKAALEPSDILPFEHSTASVIYTLPDVLRVLQLDHDHDTMQAIRLELKADAATLSRPFSQGILDCIRRKVGDGEFVATDIVSKCRAAVSPDMSGDLSRIAFAVLAKVGARPTTATRDRFSFVKAIQDHGKIEPGRARIKCDCGVPADGLRVYHSEDFGHWLPLAPAVRGAGQASECFEVTGPLKNRIGIPDEIAFDRMADHCSWLRENGRNPLEVAAPSSMDVLIKGRAQIDYVTTVPGTPSGQNLIASGELG